MTLAMPIKKQLPFLLALTLLTLACRYIVLPRDLGAATPTESRGWSAVVTNIQAEGGVLHLALTIRNDTDDWSAMQAVTGQSATLTTQGAKSSCETVFVSTGGHRLAPGFQMRGYTTGTKADPQTQLLYVECAGAEAASDATLSIPYSYVTGQFNYYEPNATKVDATLEVSLDITSDLQYPIGEPVEGLLQTPEAEIPALNGVVLRLAGVQRTDEGFQFTWGTTNPGEYPTYLHIGIPPVIGADGILYGLYESPDIATVPISPAGGKTEWATEVAVPADGDGFYILLSVESGKARLFANYAVDITDQ
jgi:hypothetical protein